MTGTRAPDRWIRPLRVSPASRATLVCMPHAGGSASFFRHWPNLLPAQYDLLAVQYPGREERYAEPGATCMEDLAERTTQALLPHAHHRPVALFGHSLGASLAYEVARRLESRGIVPLQLFASAHPAPHRQRHSRLHLLGDDALLGDVRRLAGPGADMLETPELRELFMPMLRGDYRVIETYRCTPGPRLRTPVAVLLPDGDSEVSADEAAAWQDTTDEPLRILRVEGGHFYLTAQYPEVIALLAECLDTRLDARLDACLDARLKATPG